MQKLIRETGGSAMDADVHANFIDTHAKGKLLAPELSVVLLQSHEEYANMTDQVRLLLVLLFLGRLRFRESLFSGPTRGLPSISHKSVEILVESCCSDQMYDHSPSLDPCHDLCNTVYLSYPSLYAARRTSPKIETTFWSFSTLKLLLVTLQPTSHHVRDKTIRAYRYPELQRRQCRFMDCHCTPFLIWPSPN